MHISSVTSLHKFFLCLMAMLMMVVSVKAQAWQNYPYHEEGSVLNFPRDEGYHPGEVVEWWYVNTHLKGDSTGTDYATMLTYFYYYTFPFDGFRIIEMSNENTGQFLTETQPCTYPTLSQDHLEIKANTGILGSGHEEWVTLRDANNKLIPYQYHINSAMPNGSMDLTLNSRKRPLMVGGTGFLYEGETGYTYYYSETDVEISGRISMNGITENVHGTGWIDRQWGQFNPNNGEQYTWMCMQLSNGMDFNLWNIFNTANQIPDTSTYRFCTVYMNDSTDTTMSNFTLERLKFTYTSDNQRCFDQKWRFRHGDMDLIITATHINNEVPLPFRFFEGSTKIEGTVGGVPVTGVGYVELLHSFSKPQVSITSPVGHVNWDGTTPVTWKLLNPEGGRPIYYDLEVSTDNKTTYTTIAQHITDTSYLFSPTFPLGTEGWFRVSSYSIDSTLAGSTVSNYSFIYGEPSGISEPGTSIFVMVSPNPFDKYIALTYEHPVGGTSSIEILNLSGQVVWSQNNGFKPAGKQQIMIEPALPAGMYFYRLYVNGKAFSGKLIRQQ